MSCYNSAGIPIPCGGWTQYNSYVTDPYFARIFTAAWAGTFGLFFVLTLPALVRFVCTGQLAKSFGPWYGVLGVYEDRRGGYQRLGVEQANPNVAKRPSGRTTSLLAPFLAVAALIRSVSLFTLPLPAFLSRFPRLPYLMSRRSAPSCHPARTYAPFSLGTLVLALLIPAFILVTLLPQSELLENPNRFGFLALACIPPLFVLSSKNGVVGLLLGRGWTAVNFLHRWLGRMVVLLVLLHFGLWARQYVNAGQTSDFFSSSKELRGIGALVFLLVIFVSSLPPFRRFSYPLFFALHYAGIVGFLVFINMHTIYARGWATWAVVGIYVADMLGRVASLRVRWVEAEALDGGMVRVDMKGVHGGWTGGQHLDLRLFFVPRVRASSSANPLVRWSTTFIRSLRASIRSFEAHPFSIASAPPSRGATTLSVDASTEAGERGIELFIRSCGPRTWTDDLYRSVSSSAGRKMQTLALFFGPYAGLPVYGAPKLFEDTETVLLVAGGSGMSFTLGVLDEVVGRRAREGKGGRVEVVWVVKDGAHVAWFADRLNSVISAAAPFANLSLSLQIYLTCDSTLTHTLPGPSPSPSLAAPLPPLPACTSIHFLRPQLSTVLKTTVDRALAPCGHCFPVCSCGEVNGDGCCAGEEEECVGGCGGVANGRELLVDEDGEKLVEQREKEGQQRAVATLKKGCCSAAAPASSSHEIAELPASSTPVSAAPPSCCTPAPLSSGVEASSRAPACGGGCCAGTGSGCCSGGVVQVGAQEKEAEGEVLRVRTGGLGVAVCGPRGMVAELRNAVASIPLAKQVRIGGVEMHVEHFDV
ncbi:hypothetical protein JCM1841_003053 [Sporobolomyces salmonicolor]